jgi:hypothetical protein
MRGFACPGDGCFVVGIYTGVPAVPDGEAMWKGDFLPHVDLVAAPNFQQVEELEDRDF